MSDTEALPERETTKSRWFGEWVGIIAAAVIIAVVLRTFVFQTFYIPSESMENTLLINDRVLVNKLAYRTGDIERQDIVVFHRPPSLADPTINDLIKRVIGLPGDRVEAREGKVFVNDVELSEPYLKPGSYTDRLPLTTIPEGQILVLGDNRNNSEDGRYFGTISDGLIIGKAAVRWWPLDRLDYFGN